jgi:hypothetical protein
VTDSAADLIGAMPATADLVKKACSSQHHRSFGVLAYQRRVHLVGRKESDTMIWVFRAVVAGAIILMMWCDDGD